MLENESTATESKSVVAWSWSRGGTAEEGRREHFRVLEMFYDLIVVVPLVHALCKTDQIVHFKHLLHFLLYLKYTSKNWRSEREGDPQLEGSKKTHLDTCPIHAPRSLYRPQQVL